VILSVIEVDWLTLLPTVSSLALFDRDRFDPFLVALFDDPVVVGDFARFAERLGLLGISRFRRGRTFGR